MEIAHGDRAASALQTPLAPRSRAVLPSCAFPQAHGPLEDSHASAGHRPLNSRARSEVSHSYWLLFFQVQEMAYILAITRETEPIYNITENSCSIWTTRDQRNTVYKTSEKPIRETTCLIKVHFKHVFFHLFNRQFSFTLRPSRKPRAANWNVVCAPTAGEVTCLTKQR